MKLKEFANMFGMTVKELAEETGYTKQGLYRVFSGRHGVSKNRFQNFLQKCTEITYKQYDDECRNANDSKHKKLKALHDLAKQLDGGDLD